MAAKRRLIAGVSGVNNPCPAGFRLPAEVDLDTDRLSWSSDNYNGAFASTLKLVPAGFHGFSSGMLYKAGTGGFYWSSTVYGIHSSYLLFLSNGYANMDNDFVRSARASAA